MKLDSAEQKPQTRPSGRVGGAHQHHWFRRLLTRVGWTLLVVWSAVSLTFVLSRVIPADPARLAAGMGAGAEQVAEVRRQLGLDLPLWEQYINYLFGIVRLDFGDSVQSRQPVLDDIVRFFPATLELVLLAMFIYAIVGIGLGVVWATLSDGWRSRMLAGLSILGAALPVFWTGLLLQLTLASMLDRRSRSYRRQVQAVFQQPLLALDQRRTIGWSVAEPLVIHRVGNVQTRTERAAELLGSVGLSADFMTRLPRELSGGQLQRVNIARALALEPRLLVCDEAVSALDVSVQAQVLDIFLEMQERLGIAMLFISHNIAVVRHISDLIIVMRHGDVVERGETSQVCENPRSDYAKELIGSWLEPVVR
ncbi:ABC transporter family protein [Rhodoglobus vestalii]|uniref:ABC transporter family protein n=1 Tax=Rhodoglobus vestalii TaxID=193384 RepID=A0A8H2K646_9MICO|nr:ATP-binding cassette domain-containing protein [Rhodoglobus vestalii]TQO19865.1 ABC transporter family protein [Rhodoglobus vestalii]